MEYKNAENPTPVETGYMEEFDLLPNYLALYAAIKHGLTAEKAFLLIGYHGMLSGEHDRPRDFKSRGGNTKGRRRGNLWHGTDGFDFTTE